MNTQDKTKTILTFTIMAMVVFAGPAMAALEGELGILDVSGTNPATSAPWADGDQYRFVFITSTDQEAIALDISHYNALVQGLADAAGLGDAAWNCIGSTTDGDAAGAIDARDNTSTNPEDPNDPDCPIFLLDGSTVIAVGNVDLWDGEILSTINIDENGNMKVSWPFTGTQLDGTTSAGKPNTTGGPLGTVGQVSQGNSGMVDQWIWRAWTGDPPTTLHPFYAMSEPLTVGEDDPTVPGVDAGPDMLTWTDEPVQMDATVVNNLEPTPLEYAWLAETTDTNVDIVLTPNSGDPLTSTDPAPIVAITKNDSGDDPVTVKLTLTVNNQGLTNYKSDLMFIDVYDDACAVANAVAPVTYDEGDINEDCNIDLKDFAVLAADWLSDYALSEPIPKP